MSFRTKTTGSRSLIYWITKTEGEIAMDLSNAKKPIETVKAGSEILVKTPDPHCKDCFGQGKLVRLIGTTKLETPCHCTFMYVCDRCFRDNHLGHKGIVKQGKCDYCGKNTTLYGPIAELPNRTVVEKGPIYW